MAEVKPLGNLIKKSEQTLSDTFQKVGLDRKEIVLYKINCFQNNTGGLQLNKRLAQVQLQVNAFYSYDSTKTVYDKRTSTGCSYGFSTGNSK